VARLFTTLAVAASLAAGGAGADVRLTGGRFERVIAHGETLAAIAARYGVDIRGLAATNKLADPNRIETGAVLHIDNRHLAVLPAGRSLSINIAQRMLYLARDGEIAAAYPIAVGRREWPTPTGPFTILTKEIDPTWDVPVSIREEARARGQPVVARVPPSAANPLGARWIGLSIPSLGIHGTNAPSTIYRFVSHGCVRLHPDDVATLFDRVTVGDTGVLLYEPVLVARIDGRVLLEAHPDVYGRVDDAAERLRRTALDSGLFDAIDWARAAIVLQQRHGIVTDVTRN
jgi:L,D-transpeptidase ErfK/SrfK